MHVVVVTCNSSADYKQEHIAAVEFISVQKINKLEFNSPVNICMSSVGGCAQRDTIEYRRDRESGCESECENKVSSVVWPHQRLS